MQVHTSVPIEQIYASRALALRAASHKRRQYANRLGLRYTAHLSAFGGWYLVVTNASGDSFLVRRGTSHWC